MNAIEMAEQALAERAEHTGKDGLRWHGNEYNAYVQRVFHREQVLAKAVTEQAKEISRLHDLCHKDLDENTALDETVQGLTAQLAAMTDARDQLADIASYLGTAGAASQEHRLKSIAALRRIGEKT